MSFSELLRAAQFDGLARAYEQSLVCPDGFYFQDEVNTEEAREDDTDE